MRKNTVYTLAIILAIEGTTIDGWSRKVAFIAAMVGVLVAAHIERTTR